MLFWIPSFVTLSFTNARKLNPFFPQAGLINKEYLTSFIYNIITNSLFQITIAYILFYRLTFKKPKDIHTSTDLANDLYYYEAFIFFIVEGINFIIMAVSFNRGYPFKENFYHNFKQTIYVFFVLCFLISLYFVNFFEGIFFGRWWIETFKIPQIDTKSQNYFFLFMIALNMIQVLIDKITNEVYLLQIHKEYAKSRWKDKDFSVKS